jgi:DNA-binding NtrC family response regulator
VVAATHQRLDEAVARSAFRADLHARLAGFVVDIPGLVARREEIVRLFRRFLGAGAPPLTSEGAEVLLGYGWPQNVRELKHAAERVALLSRDAEAIDSTDLPIEIREWKPHAAGAGGAIDPTQDEEIPTKEQLEKLLAEHDGNVARVARALGKHRQTLYRWLKKYDLGVTQFRKDEQE